jgi:hypothetical protein
LKTIWLIGNGNRGTRTLFAGSTPPQLGTDKAYDVREFVDDLRDLNVTPHIAQNTSNRTSAIDARTTRHPGHAISQRKRTEEPFGWAKTIGGLARPMLRGVARLRFKFTLTMAAYDLIGCRTCLARPHDRQKVVQNGIDTDQSGNHELARVQRQFSTRRRHEFQWPARSLIHLNLSSSSAQICNSLAEARTPSPRVSSWQPS